MTREEAIEILNATAPKPLHNDQNMWRSRHDGAALLIEALARAGAFCECLHDGGCYGPQMVPDACPVHSGESREIFDQGYARGEAAAWASITKEPGEVNEPTITKAQARALCATVHADACAGPFVEAFDAAWAAVTGAKP